MEGSHTLLFAILGLILVTSVKAEVDCSKPPNFLESRSCCSIPETKLDFVPQCNGNRKARHPTPCVMDCIFNASKAFDGEDLNMENLRVMMMKMVPDNKVLVEAFMIGFQKCEPIIKKKLAEMKTSAYGLAQMAGGSCSKTAAFYGMCAYKHVFISCPSDYWTSTPVCERFKEYGNACESYMDGPGKRRGGRAGRKGMRGFTGSRSGMHEGLVMEHGDVGATATEGDDKATGGKPGRRDGKWPGPHRHGNCTENCKGKPKWGWPKW